VSGVVSGEPGPTAAVIDSVERDWQEFQRLDYMGNHWERPGWAPGRRAYYWYITLGDTPPLNAMAAECQSTLNLPYLDPVPLDRLHLTVQRLAFEDEIATSQVDATARRARQLLSGVESFELNIGPLAGSRGAVRFSVSPWAPIENLRRALREAISSSTDIRPSRSESDFRPHVGIAYCNARVQAPELIQRVSQLRHLPTIQTRVSEVSLVRLSRTDRGYCWEPLATLPLRAIREVAWL